MASNSDRLLGVLKLVEPALRAEGFKRVRHSFYISRGRNTGLIVFQKSVKGTRDELKFTVNLGTHSLRIGRFMQPASSYLPLPGIDACHWQQRVGFTLPEHGDKWWTIGRAEDENLVGGEVLMVLRSAAVPQILAFLSDESLRELWLSGRSPGLTHVQRLLSLSVLLKEIGPASQLSGVIDELRRFSEGKPSEAMVEHHIQGIRQHTTPSEG